MRSCVWMMMVLLAMAMSACPGDDPSSAGRCESDSCDEGETCAIDAASGELRCFIAEDPLQTTACTNDLDCGDDEQCVDSVDGGRRCVFEGRDGGSQG